MEIFHLIFRPEVMVFMIPISAIVGGFYLSSLKIKAKIAANDLNKEERKLLNQVSQENQELKQRLANLEDIITSMDHEAIDFDKSTKKSLPYASSRKDDTPQT